MGNNFQDATYLHWAPAFPGVKDSANGAAMETITSMPKRDIFRLGCISSGAPSYLNILIASSPHLEQGHSPRSCLQHLAVSQWDWRRELSGAHDLWK